MTAAARPAPFGADPTQILSPDGWDRPALITGKRTVRNPFPLEQLTPEHRALTLRLVDVDNFVSLPSAAMAPLALGSVMAGALFQVQLPGVELEIARPLDGDEAGWRRCPATLILGQLTSPAGGKSALQQAAMKAHRAADQQLAEAHRAYAKEFKSGAGTKGSDGHTALPPPTPKIPYTCYQDTTIEALLSGMTHQPRAALCSDEVGTITNGWMFRLDNARRTYGALSSLWSDGFVAVDRVKDGGQQMRVWDGALTIYVQGQADVMSQFAAAAAAVDSGFAARVLLSLDDQAEPPLPGHWDGYDADEAGGLWRRLNDQTKVWRAYVDEGIWIEGAPLPHRRVIPLTARWHAALTAEWQDAKRRQSEVTDAVVVPELVADVRLPEIKARIAGVLATLRYILNTAPGSPERPVIGSDIIAAANALAEYYSGETLRLLMRSTDDDVTMAAQRVSERLVQLVKGEWTPPRAAGRRLPDGRIQVNANTLVASWGTALTRKRAALRGVVIEQLVAHDWLRYDDAGRPSRMMVNPRCVEADDVGE